jgi:hypothetical protein
VGQQQQAVVGQAAAAGKAAAQLQVSSSLEPSTPNSPVVARMIEWHKAFNSKTACGTLGMDLSLQSNLPI